MGKRAEILCIGSVLWDMIGRCRDGMPKGADRPGHISRLPGGVALNLAMGLARWGLHPEMLTLIGADCEGDDLIRACALHGVGTRYALRSADLPTDRYLAIEDANGLVAAIADAHSLERAGAAILAPLADGRLGTAETPWTGLIALDGNLTGALLAEIATSPLFASADLRIAPASPGKADRLRPLIRHPGATLYLNLEEAGILAGSASETAGVAAEALIAQGAARVLVTDGDRSAAEARQGLPILTATPPRVPLIRVTGAGDTFMAAHIAAELRGATREVAFHAALAAAAAHVSGETKP